MTSRKPLALVALGTLSLFACGGGDESAEKKAAPETKPAAAAAAASTGGSGGVSGKIAFEGTAPAAEKVKLNADPKCAALHKDGLEKWQVHVKDGGLADVLVYVKSGVKGTFPGARSTGYVAPHEHRAPHPRLHRIGHPRHDPAGHRASGYQPGPGLSQFRRARGAEGGGRRRVLEHLGGREIRKALRQVDGMMLGGQPGHAADDRFGEAVGPAGGVHGVKRNRCAALPGLAP